MNHPLRILIMNCQSIKNKKAELHTIIDSAKTDIILGNESWLTPDIKNSEIFPESFDAASSPIVQDRNEARTKTAKAVLNHPLRILIMNCQSIKNKKAELHTIINSAKPDIILGNESWSTPDIKNSEIFPESFDAVRKDR